MESKLTEKQRAFVANKAAGVPNRDAALAAGYSATSADVQAANMLRRPHIRDAIKKAQVPGVASESAISGKHYADPMTFLQDIMNNAKLPDAVRIDAARNLLPYQHARIGEKGKKEQRKEAAVGHAARGPRVPLIPPPLSVVRGGKV